MSVAGMTAARLALRVAVLRGVLGWSSGGDW